MTQIFKERFAQKERFTQMEELIKDKFKIFADKKTKKNKKFHLNQN